MSTLAVVNIGQLATPVPDGSPMPPIQVERHCGVLFEGGIIREIGPTKVIAANADETYDAEGRVALPGFVDCHTHAVFAGSRHEEFAMRSAGATYEEIAEAGGGILNTVEAVRNASEQELLSQSKSRIGWMLRNGTTTLEVKSGYGLDLENELKMLRVARELHHSGIARVHSTCLAAHAVPPEFRNRKGEYLDLICEQILPRCKEVFANRVDCFVEQGFFEPDDARRIASVAKKQGLKLHLHVDQLRDGGGADLAAELGAEAAGHLEHTSDEGIQALAEAGTVPVLLPASVYGLGLGKYPDARKMIEVGLHVALATDFNPGSSPCASMPMVMSIACTQMGMSPDEALAACTLNPARIMSTDAPIGCIQPEFVADMSLCDLEDYRQLPYYFGVEHVAAVFRQGRLVYQREPSEATN